MFACVSRFFSDDVFSSLSSGLVVHLPVAVWTHVRTPVHAHQTLHLKQGGLIRHTDKHPPSSLSSRVPACATGWLTVLT